MGESKVAIVTGSSRGIGKGCAIALAERGFDVVLVARTVEEGAAQELSETVKQSHKRPVPGSLQETASAIEELGRRALPVRADLAVYADLDVVVERTLAEFGRIDVLLNNARWVGQGYKDPFIETPFEVFEQSLQVNVLAPLYLTQKVLPAMIARGGGVIFSTTSRTAWGEIDKVPDSDWRGATGLAYAVSKAGLHRMGPALAKEVRQHRIAVVNLDPGDARVERKAVQRGEAFTPETMIPVEATGRTCAYIATCRDPMFYSGLTVTAASFALEHGLIEASEIPPSVGVGRYGLPERAPSVWSGLW